ncbi:MAG: hypothetical protein JST01_00135 [Cyanobacteria bacterium SZAS TMP-1]|nr:hypothetical protein [Cyanobacteria bacterium SZAS TMP-1]
MQFGQKFLILCFVAVLLMQLHCPAVAADFEYESPGVRAYFGSLEIHGPLSAKDRQSIKNRHFHNVDIMPHADKQSLGPKKIIGSIDSLLLSSDQVKHNLQYIARNYPSLKELAIQQSEPLEMASVTSLSSMSALEALHLYCPVAEPERFGKTLSMNLKRLTLERTGVPSDNEATLTLPSLLELRIYDDRIAKNFIANLSAPTLKSIYFSNVQLESGTLAALRNFPEIKSIYLYKTKFENEDMQLLQRAKPALNVFEQKS